MRNWRRFARVCTFALSLLQLTVGLSFGAAATETRDSVVLANGEWRPYQSEVLSSYGFVSQIISEAFALEGVDVSFEFRPWKRGYEEARKDMLDGTFMWRKTDARFADFYYSSVLISTETVMFHLKKIGFKWKDNAQLKAYRIGGTLGYEYSYDAVEGIKIERVATDTMNFSKLLFDRIDLFGVDKYVGYDILSREFKREEREQITHASSPHGVIDYHLLLNRKDPGNLGLLERFNAGLARLKSSGRYQDIVRGQLEGLP